MAPPESIPESTRASRGVRLSAALLPVLAALLGVGLAVSISLAEITTVLVILTWIFDWFSAGRPSWSPTRLEGVLLAYGGWGLLTGAVHHSVGLVNGVSCQEAILLYFFIAHRFGRRNAAILLTWFCGASAFCGLLGGLQPFSGVTIAPQTGLLTAPSFLQGLPRGLVHFLAPWSGRSAGTRSHPLTYSESLIAPIFVLAAVAAAPGVSRRKVAWSVTGLLLMFWGILGSQSRGVWLGTFAGLILLALLSPGGSVIRRAALLFAMAIPLILVVSPAAKGRMMSIFFQHQGSPADQKSKEIRRELWRQSLASIVRNPVSGVGLKGASFVVKDPVDGTNSEWTESHNTFLQVAVEEGLVGFALLAWALFLFARLILQGPKEWVPYGLAVLLAYLVAGLTESWMGDKEIALIFWATAGWFGLMKSGRERSAPAR